MMMYTNVYKCMLQKRKNKQMYAAEKTNKQMYAAAQRLHQTQSGECAFFPLTTVLISHYNVTLTLTLTHYNVTIYINHHISYLV